MKISRSFILFCLVGGTSAFIDILFLYIFKEHMGFSLYAAAVLSFGLASINGYFLNRKFTFKSDEKATLIQYLKFLFISIIGLGLTLLFLYLLTTFLPLHYIIAKIITIGLVIFWNYSANVLWTFKK